MVAPTNAALRAALQSNKSDTTPRHVYELLQQAHVRPPVGLELVDCLRKQFLKRQYNPEVTKASQFYEAI